MGRVLVRLDEAQSAEVQRLSALLDLPCDEVVRFLLSQPLYEQTLEGLPIQERATA